MLLVSTALDVLASALRQEKETYRLDVKENSLFTDKITYIENWMGFTKQANRTNKWA